MEIMLGKSKGYNSIADNMGISIRQSEHKQEHAKLRIAEQLFGLK